MKALYSYDAVGNRIETKKGSPLEHPTIERYTYDKANQLLDIAAAKGRGRTETKWYIKYGYDANGSPISKTTDTATTSYEYDYENMLKKVTFPDGTTNEYTCSCGVERSAKDSTGWTSYLNDNYQGIDNVLLEYDEAGTIKAENTLGPGIDEVISRKTAEKTIYYHYDSLGSVKFLTDDAGNLIGNYEYEPFGQILSKPEGIDNRFTFTGREYYQDSGLYYYRARYYAPEVGRFLTKDPLLNTISTSPPASVGGCSTCGNISGCGTGLGLNIYNPSNLHPYVYVGNNPVNYTDPTGLHTVAECQQGCTNVFLICVAVAEATFIFCLATSAGWLIVVCIAVKVAAIAWCAAGLPTCTENCQPHCHPHGTCPTCP